MSEAWAPKRRLGGSATFGGRNYAGSDSDGSSGVEGRSGRTNKLIISAMRSKSPYSGAESVARSSCLLPVAESFGAAPQGLSPVFVVMAFTMFLFNNGRGEWVVAALRLKMARSAATTTRGKSATSHAKDQYQKALENVRHFL